MPGDSKLIVFSGLPGTGKTTLAERIAQKHRIPLFSIDRLEASIVVSNLNFPTKHDDYPNLAGAGISILSTLAEQQLTLGQSAILDSTARSQKIRADWFNVASRHNASFHAIHCICSDQIEHESRLVGRTRRIPGWYEITWEQVLKASQYFESLTTDHLICDSMHSVESNFAMVEEYIGVG